MSSSKRARLDSTVPDEVAQYAQADVSVSKAAQIDKDAGLRARMLDWSPDTALESFPELFWRRHIGLAERDYCPDGEDEDDEEDEAKDPRVLAAPVLTDWKQHTLPLARIKKVAKLDPEAKMLAAEVPILFARACEVFIAELTTRAWIEATQNKRKTLSRSDIAAAAAQTETMDFLIDIVGRESIKECPRAIKEEEMVALPDLPQRSPIDMEAIAREEEAAESDEYMAMANGAPGLDWDRNELEFIN